MQMFASTRLFAVVDDGLYAALRRGRDLIDPPEVFNWRHHDDPVVVVDPDTEEMGSEPVSQLAELGAVGRVEVTTKRAVFVQRERVRLGTGLAANEGEKHGGIMPMSAADRKGSDSLGRVSRPCKRRSIAGTIRQSECHARKRRGILTPR
jgi:hypothetical protein